MNNAAGGPLLGMGLIVLSDVIELGMITYPGLPGPVIDVHAATLAIHTPRCQPRRDQASTGQRGVSVDHSP